MIYATQETLPIWSALPKHDRSRSLAADRFVDFPNNRDDKDWRRRTSEAVRDGKADPTKSNAWPLFVKSLGAIEIHAVLQARLMVNMAVGVFENGNLALDRNSGIPTIPGSAVKGCARRFAIHSLAEAPAAQKLPLLKEIAAVFGWGDQDWKSGRKKSGNGSKGEFYSDFELACGSEWESCKDSFKDLPAQASGRIAFLPAYPVHGDPGIELDVLTSHHKAYYEAPHSTATDTEEPVPVLFPTVSAARKPCFLFAIHPLRPEDASLAKKASQWLSQGLETLGIGAKTAAGYGWFHILAQAEVEAAEAQAAQAASDYPTDLFFRNTVIARLNKPQEYQNLQAEIIKLAKPENSPWLVKLKFHLAATEGKDARKRLKDKDWFPKEWLPQS